MKALVLTEYNKLEWMEVPKPDVGADEVLIRIMACAVCGSDVHGIDGSTGRRRPPIIMGHEAAGVIEACGSDVRNFRPGDRVTFDSTLYCRVCDACKSGRINLCDHRRVLGVSCEEYRQSGAFAEYLAVPEYVLYRLPDAVSFVQASMVEPFSVAYHAVTRAPIPKDGVALVIGAGTIGMLAVQTLRAQGAGTIIVADIVPEKLQFALQHGADHVVDSRDDSVLEQIRQLTRDGRGAEVCYDATGIQPTVNLALHAVKKGGHVVLVGNLAPEVTFPLQWVVTREVSVLGSCASAGEYDPCLRLIAEGKVDVDALISEVVPMADGHAWIQRLRSGESGLSKLVMVP